MTPYRKSFLISLFLVLIMTACSEKHVADIKPYESFYTNQTAKKKIVFNGIKDERTLPIISYIMKNNRVVSKFLSNQDIKSWYEEAFKREFHASDIIFDQQKKDPRSAIIQITIKEVKAEYHRDILTQANLIGKVSLEISLQKNNKVVKKLVNTSQSEFKISITDAEGFEDFIHALMSDSIAKSTAIIIETINSL